MELLLNVDAISFEVLLDVIGRESAWMNQTKLLKRNIYRYTQFSAVKNKIVFPLNALSAVLQLVMKY